MALYALQQFAPPGGAGNRTSLRGGGTMTTLVWPHRLTPCLPAPLWRVLLCNLPLSVSGAGYLEDEAVARALPWLASTLTSEGKPPLEISQTDPRAHPLQAFFGMPRRIRLVMGGDGDLSDDGERADRWSPASSRSHGGELWRVDPSVDPVPAGEEKPSFLIP